MTTAQNTSWIGKSLGGCTIDALLGEGAFSWVFKTASKDSEPSYALKVAKPTELIGLYRNQWPAATEARIFTTGGTMKVHPDGSRLLEIQSRKIKSANDPALVKILATGTENDTSYCRMELFEGLTLREVMKSGPVKIEILIQLAEAIDRLRRNPNFEYHGDLKPENIMVADNGIKLLDPGYFGPLDCREGFADYCAVSSLAYYPLLEPDDLFALGMILWELACRRHPLSGHEQSESHDRSKFGDELVQWIREKEMVGQYFLTPILDAVLQIQLNPDLHPVLQPVLMKAIRLRINADTKVDKDVGFESCQALCAALEGLRIQGINEL